MWTAALERGLRDAIDKWIVSRRVLNKFCASNRRRVPDLGEASTSSIHAKHVFLNYLEFEKATSQGETPITQADTWRDLPDWPK